MFGDVESKAHENGLIESLSLAVNLGMTRCCCQASNTEEGAYRSKTFAEKLSTIVRENVDRDVVRHERMIKKRFAMFVAIVLDVEVAQISLEYRSVMTSMY